MRKLNVGVVGVGHLGMHHARIYNEMDDVNLVGVVDVNEARAREIAAPFSVPAYYSLSRFIEEAHPDALSIAVPTTAHFAPAMYAIKHGIDILIEKPITFSMAEALEIKNAAEKNNVLIQVGHIERFNGGFKKALQYIDKPYLIETHRIAPFSARISDVGVILDLFIHDIDLIMSIADSPLVGLRADGASIRSSHEDIASIKMRFKNGIIAHSVVSRVSQTRRRTMHITQEDKYITIDFAQQSLSIEHIAEDGKSIIEAPETVKCEQLKAELEDFVSCVRCRRKPLVGADEGIHALEISLEALDCVNKAKNE